MFGLFSSTYSLSHCRKILKQGYACYRKKGEKLSKEHLSHFEALLKKLDALSLEGKRKESSALAHEVETFVETHFKKSHWVSILELILAIIVAFSIAMLVRQSWFEHMEIPTGSMRPTFKEQDLVTVTKTQFGINTPFIADHLYFDPNSVERGGAVIWSGENIPLYDTDTTYFWVIPYKKRYIKRLIGKPGDSLYFYGGKVYGVDKEGAPLKELLETPSMEKLAYIPFMTFDGTPSGTGNREIVFKHFNQPIGKLSLTRFGSRVGQIKSDSGWVVDDPAKALKPRKTPQTFSDFYGMGNFAMARLLTAEQVKMLTDVDLSALEEGLLYLELRHTPSLNYPQPTLFEDPGHRDLALTPMTTVIPLQKKHLKNLWNSLYTARFIVENGRARQYSVEKRHSSKQNPKLVNIPDGTYEFYYGKGYRVGFGGTVSELPEDHPLYSQTPENLQRLFNLGISFNQILSPREKGQRYYPSRYAYFREGDLYTMGGVVMKEDDPLLQSFVRREEEKQERSSSRAPYIAFVDRGPPLKDGELDATFIRSFGLTLPEKSYIVLGDNHAMSADSRTFGFLPEDNIQGRPSLIIWPVGKRLGIPNQAPYPIFVLPRLFVWGLAALIIAICYGIYRRNTYRPFF